MSSFVTFLLIQLDRIARKPTSHAPGPKKPTLQQQDYGKHK